MGRQLAVACVAVLAGVAACERTEGPRKQAPEGAPAPDSKPDRLVKAGPGEVVDVVREAIGEASADHMRLVVYVGAGWCEPCTYFKQALAGGEFDSALAGVRFLEFDFDEDADRLRAAGYESDLLPEFVVPRADGRGGERRMQGAIKGPGAVKNILPRLEKLLQ